MAPLVETDPADVPGDGAAEAVPAPASTEILTTLDGRPVTVKRREGARILGIVRAADGTFTEAWFDANELCPF